MRPGPLAAVAPLVIALLAAVSLAIGLPAREAVAQSVDDCMEAPPAQALSLCRTVIDEGRGNADVWTQLALSLDKSGRGADARATIDEALMRYPRDADLLALRDRLAASSSEAERLEQAARRNGSAVAQGELKLLCLTRQGVAAIEACRRYLAATDVDGDRLRARLAELERALPSVAEAPPTEPRPRPSSGISPEPSSEPPPKRSPSGQPPSEQPREPVETPRTEPEAPADGPADTALTRLDEPPSTPDPDAERRRERVASIQRALAALGLSVGVPDGIAGPRTREALANFDALTGRAGSALDDATLAALEAERSRLEAATVTLATSETAARAERFDEALELLARAESASTLLHVSPSYRTVLERSAREVEEARRRDEEVRRDEEQRGDENGTPDIVPDTAPDTLRDDSPDSDVPAADDALAGLLVRIGTLERQLADAEESARRDAARLREQVQRTLARP